MYFESDGGGIAARAAVWGLWVAISVATATLPAHADLIGLPIVAPPDGIEVSLDLGGLSLTNLDQPEGYTVSFDAVTEPNFTNRIGDILLVNGSITFSPDPGIDFDAGLLVFTSLRSGSGDISNCAIGVQRAPLAFRSDSFTVEDASVDALLVSDPMGPGTLCDDEGSLFLALLFEGSPGTSQDFGFSLELTDPLDFSQPLQIVNDAFVITPEPSTLPMIVGGLAFFAARRRTGWL